MPIQVDIEYFIEGQYRKYFQYTLYAEYDYQYAGLRNNVLHALRTSACGR